MSGTALVPGLEKCTSIVPKLELESPQIGAVGAEKGESASWHGTCSIA